MYSTVQDVRNALAPGASPEGTASSLEDTEIEDAIRQADTIINNYVSRRYRIMLSEQVTIIVAEVPVVIPVAPQPVRYWSRDIAAYLATLTYKRNQDVTEDDPVRLRMSLTMQQLVAVQNGTMVLALPPVGGEDDGTVAAIVNQYTGNLFGPSDFDLGPSANLSGRGIWPGGPGY